MDTLRFSCMFLSFMLRSSWKRFIVSSHRLGHDFLPLDPVLKHRGQFLNDLGVICGQVSGLRTVLGQVVEVPRTFAFAHQLPVTSDYRLRIVVVEVVGVVVWLLPPSDHRYEAQAFMLGNGLTDSAGNPISQPPGELTDGYINGKNASNIKADGYLRNWHLAHVLKKILKEFRDE